MTQCAYNKEWIVTIRYVEHAPLVLIVLELCRYVCTCGGYAGPGTLTVVCFPLHDSVVVVL